MSDNLTVRFVAKSDFDRWLPLWDGYNAFYGCSGKTALAREITEMTWARFFDGYELVHGLVAESDGALHGLTHYLFHRSTIAIEPNCYLQDLFTAEASRRKGVGRALIEEVYRQASSRAADASIGTRRRPTAPPERFTTRLQSIWGSSGITNSFDTLWINDGAARASGKRAEPRKCPP